MGQRRELKERNSEREEGLEEKAQRVALILARTALLPEERIKKRRKQKV